MGRGLPSILILPFIFHDRHLLYYNPCYVSLPLCQRKAPRPRRNREPKAHTLTLASVTIPTFTGHQKTNNSNNKQKHGLPTLPVNVP